MSTLPATDTLEALGLARAALPRHIAVIMDGNGRWASERGLSRLQGHRRGVEAVRATVTECARLGIECLTLYSFSAENWKRPRSEVDGLMGLYAEFLASERRLILDNQIRVTHLGERNGLPVTVLRELDETCRQSESNTGLRLCLALNYGSRAEIIRAVQRIAINVRDGHQAAERIDEACFSAELYTAGLPDPDLLIRTAGEMRISNYLLWQISYAEIYVTPVLWPDFREGDLHAALREFSARERRFGNVPASGDS